jgi:large subunit ribosomal protein L5
VRIDQINGSQTTDQATLQRSRRTEIDGGVQIYEHPSGTQSGEDHGEPGLGEASQNAKALEASVNEIAVITGQKPVITRAKKAIASFKIRQGMPVGVMVTLRAQRMDAFLDRFINLALPRIRDFRGVSPKSFDGRGNYTVGVREQLMFPEISYDDVDQVRGMDISIITTANTDEEGRALLRELGMPFRES